MAKLPRGIEWRNECSKIRGVAEFANVPPLAGRLVSARQATFKELSEDYSLEDAMQMDEIATLTAYHQWLATKDVGNGR